MFTRLVRSGFFSYPISPQNLAELQKILQGTGGLGQQASKPVAVLLKEASSVATLPSGLSLPYGVIVRKTFQQNTYFQAKPFTSTFALPVFPLAHMSFRAHVTCLLGSPHVCRFLLLAGILMMR